MSENKTQGLDVFITLLNQKALVKMNKKDHMFSKPQPSVAAMSTWLNTYVRINAKQVDTSYGIIFKYDRVDLGSVPSITVSRGSAKTIYDLLDSINLAIDDIICEDDIFDAELPLVGAPQEMKVVLRTKPDSYVWLGKVEITVTT